MSSVRDIIGPLCPNISTLILHVPLTMEVTRVSHLAAPLRMVLDSPTSFPFLESIVLKLEYDCSHTWTLEGSRCDFDLNAVRETSKTVQPCYQQLYDVIKELFDARNNLQLYVHLKTFCEPELVCEIDLMPWFGSITDAERIHVGT